MSLLLRYLLLILRWVPSSFLWKAIRMQITGCGALSLSLFQKRVTISCCYSLRDWWCWTILYAILVGSAFSFFLTWNADRSYSYWKCLFGVYILQCLYLIFFLSNQGIAPYGSILLKCISYSFPEFKQDSFPAISEDLKDWDLGSLGWKGLSSYFIFQWCCIPVIFSSRNIGMWSLLSVVRYFSVFYLCISISFR